MANRALNILWLMPPSQIEGEVPLVSQNRWFKYLPFRCNFIYPVIAGYGVSMLQEAGHNVRFWDCPAENMSQLSKVLDVLCDYDLVVMEGRTAVMHWLWQLTKWFKEVSPTLKVALYGDHVMNYPAESFGHGVDFVINCGDYDFGVNCLANEFETLKDKTPIRVDAPLMDNLNSLPFLDRDVVPWEHYFESWRHRDEFGWFQSGRGCWARCLFCSWVYTFYKHTIRVMSPQRIADEVEYATDTWGIREYLDDADTFLTGWGLRFAKEVRQRDLDIYWNMQTRADEILKGSVDDWKTMKDSRLHVVKLGVDGGSDLTLQRIYKGYSMETVEKAMKRLKAANLETHINMIVGWPWETKQQAYDVIKWVQKLAPNQAQFSLIEPFPGTPIFQWALDQGWFIHDPYDWTKYDMKQPILQGEMSADEIAELHREAWRRFYFSPKFMAQQLWKSLKFMWRERNLDSFRHLYRGYKSVKHGHMEAVKV